MRPLTALQDNVLSIVLRHSIENPITGAKLSELTKTIDDPKTRGANMRSVVNALRYKGWPICASGGGYYYAETPEELDEFIKSFEDRVRKQQFALEGLRHSHFRVKLPPPPPKPLDKSKIPFFSAEYKQKILDSDRLI